MSNITLYQANELARLHNHIDDDGVVDIESFDQSKIALKEKQLAVVAYLKNNDANIGMLDNAIKQLQDRKKAMQTRHDSLKDYLLTNMQANGITEINAENLTFTAKIKNNPASVVIDDESLLPADYMRQPETPPPAPDKTLIKKAINDGFEVPGARLTQGFRLDIK